MEPMDERALSKLRWRCRRGMLENDLFLERFFQRHEHRLTARHADALARIDPDALAPREALDALYALKRLLADEA